MTEPGTNTARAGTALIAETLRILGDGWTLMLVAEALAGTRRFGAFQRNTGVATNILSSRLRVLIEHGIVEMRACAERSDWREYHLTEKGQALSPVISALRQWASEHAVAVAVPSKR